MKVGRYSNHNEFARDVRRCVGNFLHYNFGPGNSKMRRDVGRVLSNFEDKWKALRIDVQKGNPSIFFSEPLPELKECLLALEDVMKVSRTLSTYAQKDVQNAKHIC